MLNLKMTHKAHLDEMELSDYLDRTAPRAARERVEAHMDACPECLANMVSAYESVRTFKKGKEKKMKNNIYLILASAAFVLSFLAPRYFAQFLVAAALLGIKWIADAKTARMLVMIYDAWKDGRDDDISGILGRFERKQGRR